MWTKLRWTEPVLGAASPSVRAIREVDAELDGEFFDKIAAAIEARAMTLLDRTDPRFDHVHVDAGTVRGAMAAIASVFRDIAKADHDHEAMADRAARAPFFERPCPPGMFCIHEPRCPGAANKDR